MQKLLLISLKPHLPQEMTWPFSSLIRQIALEIFCGSRLLKALKFQNGQELKNYYSKSCSVFWKLFIDDSMHFHVQMKCTKDYYRLIFVEHLLRFMSPRKKGRFRLLFNLETMKFRLWLDSNPGPHAPQSDPLTTIPNFLMKIFSKFLGQILKDFYNLSAAESPVGSNNNRRFLLKRQKTRNAHIFWPRPNFSMKFSEMYRKVRSIKFLS